jgi:hypothetical protein
MVAGGGERVGHQFWYHPEVSRAVRTDGASFAVVTAGPIDMPADLAALAAVNVVAPAAVGEAFAIVVRPDRYVAAVVDSHSGLVEAAGTLVAHAR